MKQLLRRHSKAVVAAGVSTVVLLGGGAAFAASNSASAGGSQPNASTAKPKPGGVESRLVFGKVSSITAPAAPAAGTSSGAGSISLSEPDGSTFTAAVLPKTKVYAYVAPGKKPVTEALSAVQNGDEVALYIRKARDRDTGTTGTGAAGSGTSAGTGAPTTPAVPVVARIVDLTGAVPSTTTG